MSNAKRLPLPADSAVLWDKLDALANATHAGNDNPDLCQFEVLHGQLVRYEPGKTVISYEAVDRLAQLGWLTLSPPSADREFGYDITRDGKKQLEAWHQRQWVLYQQSRLRLWTGGGGK